MNLSRTVMCAGAAVKLCTGGKAAGDEIVSRRVSTAGVRGT